MNHYNIDSFDFDEFNEDTSFVDEDINADHLYIQSLVIFSSIQKNNKKNEKKG